VLRLFQRSLSGVVTGSYPDVPEPAPPAYRGQVMLRIERCTGDGACARVCPSDAIGVSRSDQGWVWALTDARCVFCGLCQDACPTQAIVLSNEFELSVRDASDLTTTVSFVLNAEKVS
jgi:formate hydrogenlyase subunit 6/NADH:ubiquinone oxidoreductase subunit I